MLPSGVKPPLIGSRMLIWKQDPTVLEIGIRKVYIPSKVSLGPRDSQIEIRGIQPILPDTNGDFLFKPPDTSYVYDIFDANTEPLIADKVFDAVHTYAVTRKVLTMYRQVLGRPISWLWNSETDKGPLYLYPHAGFGKTAYYDRSDRALKFFYVFQHLKPAIFSCRSSDLIAHEAAHAILDSFQPEWLPFYEVPLQTTALHESFGDLTAIFLVLSQFDLVEHIIAETKADLHYQKNILAVWSEQLELLPDVGGPRYANNVLKLSEVGDKAHDVSKVFTGAVYDILADVFTSMRDSRVRDDAETLFRTGRYMAKLTINSLIESPAKNPVFKDTAEKMIEITEKEGRLDYAKIIEKNFTYREILGPNAFKNNQMTLAGDLTACGAHLVD